MPYSRMLLPDIPKVLFITTIFFLLVSGGKGSDFLDILRISSIRSSNLKLDEYSMSTSKISVYSQPGLKLLISGGNVVG